MDITSGNCCCNSQVIYTVVYDKIVSSKMTPESALLSLNRTCTSWASESWYLWQGCHSETACIQGQQHKATVPWALERVIQTLVIFHLFSCLWAGSILEKYFHTLCLLPTVTFGWETEIILADICLDSALMIVFVWLFEIFWMWGHFRTKCTLWTHFLHDVTISLTLLK